MQLNKSNIERNVYIDIVKAIGIISIVIGHGVNTLKFGNINIQISRFVYLYHVEIFFFCSGFLFKEENIKNPFNYVGKKVKSLWLPFAYWTNFLLILYPLCIKIGILQAEYLTNEAFFKCFMNNLIFVGCAGPFGNALWFVYVLFFTLIEYCFINNIIDRVITLFKIKINKHLIRIIIFSCIGVAGWNAICFQGLNLTYSIQLTFISLPFVCLGNIAKEKWEILERYIMVIPAMIVGILMYYLSCKYNVLIAISGDLTRISLYEYIFYTLLGVYMCLGIARGLNKFKKLSKKIAVIGNYSFEIMALHLLIFKLVDWVYINLSQSGWENLPKFSVGFDSMKAKLVYVVCGVLIPILFIKCIKYIETNIDRHISQKNTFSI